MSTVAARVRWPESRLPLTATRTRCEVSTFCRASRQRSRQLSTGRARSRTTRRTSAGKAEGPSSRPSACRPTLPHPASSQSVSRRTASATCDVIDGRAIFVMAIGTGSHPKCHLTCSGKHEIFSIASGIVYHFRSAVHVSRD